MIAMTTRSSINVNPVLRFLAERMNMPHPMQPKQSHTVLDEDLFIIGSDDEGKSIRRISGKARDVLEVLPSV